MASAVASKVVVPKPSVMDILASPSASAGRLANTGGAPLRCSDDSLKVSTGEDGVKGSTSKDGVKVSTDADGVKVSTGEDGFKVSTGEDGVKVSTGENGVKGSTGENGVKGSTGEDAAANRRRDSIPKLFPGDDPLDEAAMLDLLLALKEHGVAASMTGFSSRGFRVSKEDVDTVQLKLAMPGLGKEHVKMRVEKGVLVIKGEGDKDSEGDDDKGQAQYTYRIGLPSQAFKMDQIKAEMKNGVLAVTLPKIKDEERKDVFEIKVE